jgi:alpha-amylase/alpha-mannosidase (GH57 family)
MKQYVCIHGHFYQPPRENPWTGRIDRQSSAFPYHDWNERILHECYRPNMEAELLDERRGVVKYFNNYEWIGFNFGPTLLWWLSVHAPEVYDCIIESDKKSVKRLGGHGNAIAQVYNHIILPLASARDKETQVVWGIKDFKKHFGRKPEGMWLAETAVDTETLCVMADYGIYFTILSPKQANSVRTFGQSDWRDVSNGRIDPSKPYVCNLPNRKKMVIFFYDMSISGAVAFERILHDGELFLKRIKGGFNKRRTWNQVVTLATDGETYGHHYRYGEKALAYVLNKIRGIRRWELINHGAYLEMCPPDTEVSIIENSSWSCAHGVGRWCEDCGCSSGGKPRWHQRWRAPLREALNWLKDSLDDIFERATDKLLRDPWDARNHYCDIFVEPLLPERLHNFFDRHARKPLTAKELMVALQALEMQRFGLYMFTSCGWFFSDISGIETVQNLLYAARTIQLAGAVAPQRILEPFFIEKLSKAQSNRRKFKNGGEIYKNIGGCPRIMSVTKKSENETKFSQI